MTKYKTNHISGPWIFNRKGFKIAIGTEQTGTPTTTGFDYLVCEIDDNSFQAESNAKLIASAPELLETLIGTMNALSRMIDKHDPDSIETEWIGNAHEVILKATRVVPN
jgi:hypothetical protein